MQRINTNLSPLQCWKDFAIFLTSIVFLPHSVSSSFAATLWWWLSYHYFYLSHHSDFVSCGCVISGNSYLSGVCASPPHTPPFIILPLSSADVFNPETHQRTLPNAEWSHSSSPAHIWVASHSWGFFFSCPCKSPPHSTFRDTHTTDLELFP